MFTVKPTEQLLVTKNVRKTFKIIIVKAEQSKFIVSSTFASPTKRSSDFTLISMGPKWCHRQFSVKVVVFNTHPNIQNVMNSCRAAPTTFLKSSPTTVFHIHLLRLVQTLIYFFFSFLGIIQHVKCVFLSLCLLCFFWVVSKFSLKPWFGFDWLACFHPLFIIFTCVSFHSWH